MPKTFRVTVNEVNPDGTVGALTSMCEFELQNPPTDDSTIFGYVKQYYREELQAEADQPMYPGDSEYIRLANASGLTVKVTVQSSDPQVFFVSGCVLEDDAVAAVMPRIKHVDYYHISTEIV